MMEEDSFEQYYQDQYFGSSQEDYGEEVQLQNAISQLAHQQPRPQGEAKQQIQKETPTQFFQFSEENVACKICYKYAINGVLCKNQKCSILFCGICAIDAIKKIDNKCPFCRISPFQYVESPFKSVINKMELVCQLCHQKYTLQEEQTHYKRKCQHFKKIECQFCQESMLPEQIVKHIRLQHEDKLDQIIQKMYGYPRGLLQPKEVIKKNEFYLKKINKVPHLGSTGKFYCGGRLQGPKCTCCNGYCGPSNGQNCLQCMKLDIKRLGLKKGYLMNSAGNICWKKGDDFICGVMIYHQNTNCKEGSPCRACKNMNKNIKRYLDLL